MSRRTIVAANWKMHHLAADARAFCAQLAAPGSPYAAGSAGGGSGQGAGGAWGSGAAQGAGASQGPGSASGPAAAVEAVLFPAFPLLPVVAAGLAGSAAALGGQDLHPADAGAHTGDVSAAQLADAGCTWALAGHSERRHDHGEDDALVAAKIAAALRHGLKPMVCLGETGEERKAGRTLEVLDRQLAAALDALPRDAEAFATGFAVAYEPVWAIGTGDTATPETAQEAHAHLRRRTAELRGEAAAKALRILYGGSVKPGNAAELIRQPDVDGFLVGGASLDAGSFLAIIAACA